MLRRLLGLDDHIMTLKLTPNRADCLSVLGVAREVAAAYQYEFRCCRRSRRFQRKNKATSSCPHLARPKGCGRFAGRVIRNVDAKAPTPDWMKQRLERAGQRSISALVDVTNYVMLELGRPLHVYDLDKLKGRDRRALGPQGREGAAAERAGRSRSIPRCCASPTIRASSASAASWAARAPRPTRARATCSSSRRSSTPRRSRGARGATTSRATPRTASSAAWTSTTTSTASSAPRA